MNLPAQFLNSICNAKGFDENSFVRCHLNKQKLTSIRINPYKSVDTGLTYENAVPWCNNAYYLSERPSFTLDPNFHAGAYYVQEAGSMFIEFAIRHTVNLSEKITALDLCAAPGGKSTHLNSLISPESLLISNEVIKTRAEILSYNLSKWGTCNTAVTCSDPSSLTKLECVFDLIVADVPCSGSGLFRKQPEAVNEWSVENVYKCSLRQKRILADILPALKPDGVLIYSTCSYSEQENEEIIQWMMKEFGLEFISLPIDISWGIVNSEFGYRFYPDKTKSEGFFCAALRKTHGDIQGYRSKKNYLEPASQKELQLLQKNIHLNENHVLLKFENSFKLVNQRMQEFLNNFGPVIYIRKTGTAVGEFKNEDFIPDHELALSIYNKPEKAIELDKAEALQFLRKENMQLRGEKGINLIRYNGLGLGWAKIMDNRMNNYLPKEFRILNADTD